MKKWDWEMTPKNQRIYDNLCKQVDKVFRHSRECSKESRVRYKDGVKHFSKFMAEAYHKQNLNRIENKHLEAYVEQAKEAGYSKSYISTNLSAVRYFYDKIGKDSSYFMSNKELGADPRTKVDRIGETRSWTNKEVEKFQEKAIELNNIRYADMIQIARTHGLRIHEVTRLDKNTLHRALKEDKLTVKGKGGLIRSIPVRDKEIIQKLYDQTEAGAKVFVGEHERTHEVIDRMQSFIYNHRDNIMEQVDGRSRITFHGLRHSYAQERYVEYRDQGMSEVISKLEVAKELGHFRPEITETYLK